MSVVCFSIFLTLSIDVFGLFNADIIVSIVNYLDILSNLWLTMLCLHSGPWTLVGCTTRWPGKIVNLSANLCLNAAYCHVLFYLFDVTVAITVRVTWPRVNWFRVIIFTEISEFLVISVGMNYSTYVDFFFKTWLDFIQIEKRSCLA